MKTILCLLVLALFVATLAETPKDKLRKYSDECKSVSGVSDEVLEKARNGEHIDDPKLKKHGVCILKKAGFMNDSGELQIETMKTKFKDAIENHDAIDKLVKKCAVQKDTPEESSDHFFRCVYEAKEKAAAAAH